jgi:beta-lactamase regulating signal transducer with metallopeptidase domain
MTPAILDHLWQSTCVALLAYALTLFLRNNSASVRYWLWFAASMKFLLPFSLLTALGHVLFVHPVAASSMAVLTKIQPAAAPFSAAPLAAAPVAGHSVWLGFLVAIWLLGFVSLAAFWFVRWCRLQATMRSAIPMALDVPVFVRTTPLLLEPGLVGIWRPVILLPEGIASRLSRTEIDAILTHELCHLRRRDNLLAVVHMLVEGIFWFHPLVWFIGARLVEEREHACDEGVLASGKNPLVYAQAILNVCRLYFRSPLACASGVSGADLDRRITAIMANRDVHDIDLGRKFLLVSLGLFIVMAPIVTGGLKSAPAAQMAQSIAKVFLPGERTGDQAGNQVVEPTLSDVVSAAAPARDVTRHRQRKITLDNNYAVRNPTPEAPLTAPVIAASPPVIDVPAPQIAIDSNSVVKPAGDADLTICRPPQELPGSRLMGPQVCLPKPEWDRMKMQGVLLLPDGRTLTGNYDNERILHSRPCNPRQFSATSGGSWDISCF